MNFSGLNSSCPFDKSFELVLRLCDIFIIVIMLVVGFCSDFGGHKDYEGWVIGIGVRYHFKKPRGWQKGRDAMIGRGSIHGRMSQSLDFCLVEASNDG
jgi:hypothetical protein